MRRSLASRFSAAAAVLSTVALLGCGTPEYKQRLNTRVRTLGEEAAAGKMQPPLTLPGVPLSIQLPLGKDLPLVRLPAGTDQRRMNLPGVDLPDLKLTFEGTLPEQSGARQFFYCYVAARNVSAIPGDPEREHRKKLATELTGEDSALPWRPVECEDPNGAKDTWLVARVNGKDDFYYVDAQQKESYLNMPGAVVIYVRRKGDYLVTIAWRMRAIFLDQKIVDLDKWGPLVAGSVTVGTKDD